jgi:dihydrofolate reductase
MVPYVDQDFGAIVEGWFGKADAVLLGRTTYEVMEPYWSNVTDPNNGVAKVLNHGRKYVISSTLTSADWGDTTVIHSLDDVRELKEQAGGELQVHGSAELVASLHNAGLIDEYRLLIFPVTVGAGKRLFTPQAPPSGYEVLTTRTTGKGASYVELRPTAFSANGAFAVEDGKESH